MCPFVKKYTTKTTTMYRYPGEWDLTNIFRPNTEINRNSRLQPIDTLMEPQILTMCLLRMLGKILFVIVLYRGVANPWFIGPWLNLFR